MYTMTSRADGTFYISFVIDVAIDCFHTISGIAIMKKLLLTSSQVSLLISCTISESPLSSRMVNTSYSDHQLGLSRPTRGSQHRIMQTEIN